jgi:hypothetical protein
MQKRNKAIVAGLSVSAVAAAVALTGSTSAYYYDLETSHGNKIAACGFDLTYKGEVDGDPSEKATFTDGKLTIDGVEPGDAFSALYTVGKVGDCETDLYISGSAASLENTIIDPEADAGDETASRGELHESITVSLPGVHPALQNMPAPESLEIMQFHHEAIDNWFDSHDDVRVRLDVNVPKGAAGDHNEIMTDSFEYDFDLQMVQEGAPAPELS